MKSHITTLCPTCGPDCCPVISVDDDLPKEKQIEISDDFGGKVHMSRDQLKAFVDQAISGQINF